MTTIYIDIIREGNPRSSMSTAIDLSLISDLKYNTQRAGLKQIILYQNKKKKFTLFSNPIHFFISYSCRKPYKSTPNTNFGHTSDDSFTTRNNLFKDIKEVNVFFLFIYIYIYMCVCVCVCVCVYVFVCVYVYIYIYIYIYVLTPSYEQDVI